MNTGIIILAAGNSSRLGKPKQLVSYQGKTLLDIASMAAIESSCKPLVVVLGAYASEILEQHQHAGISYIINESWAEGMSSSISAGLTTLLAQDNTLQQLIIAVADQPFISSEIFEILIKKQQHSGKSMVASSYAQTIGTPALFRRKYFDELLSLSGNEGAKHLLKQYPEDRETISFELGHIDIDTETDYNNLINYR